MATRRASLLQRSFIPLIFGNEKLTLSLCLPVYNQLERDPGQVSRIITDEDLMLQLLSNFNQCASRIAQFFALLNKNDVNRAKEGMRRKSCVGPSIADELIEGVLSPLLSEDFQRFQLTSPFLDLFTSIIDFCLPSHPRSLEALAKKLNEKRSLLGALVSGENSVKVMREWIRVFRITIFDHTIIGEWTRCLIAQCRCCESDHGVSEHLGTWKELEDLIGSLTSMLQNYPRATENSLPTLGVLRKLTGSDKKSSVTTRAYAAGPKLPSDVKDALQHFQIPPFNSERALVHALKTLEYDEVLNILLAIAESFPCRPCYEASISPSAAKFDDLEDMDNWETVNVGSFMFTELFGCEIGIWRVLVSSQALKDLEDAHYQGDFSLVEPKLIQLASGDWLRDSSFKRVVEDVYGILYLSRYASDKGVLWQTDVGFDEGSDKTQQLVKIWRIGDAKVVCKPLIWNGVKADKNKNKTCLSFMAYLKILQISQAIPQIISMNRRYPPARLKACKEVSIDKVTGRNWPLSSLETFDMANRVPNQDKVSDERPSATMFQFHKFHMVTQTTIDNILSGNVSRGEYPLVLSREEIEIIKDSAASTLVLGRSGTGKTTCLVYKLFSRYLVAYRSGIGRPKRQVLLTRSGVLANKLEMYTKRLLSTQLISEADSTVGDNDNSLHLNMQDDDREVNDTVFSLKEGDFPLVCSFGHFMKLLENTTRAANRKDFSLAGRQYQSQAPEKWDPSMGSKRTWQRLFRRSQVVDFEVFSEEYWPSFPSGLTKDVSATLAFMEIIGVIKGSACISRSGGFSPLSRDEYQMGGYKISPVSINRDALYDIYQRYEIKKRQFGDVDDIDKARSVLEAISNNQELKKRIEGAFDEIYVDEIQDQRLLEIVMLLHLIKRPDAIHLAGDTAQSISKDSVFRFQSVKDLLFKHFSLSSATAPHLRKLHKNYRTHQGILSVATSVMRQLYGCFPHLVDSLPDEVGEVSGPKPTVFVGFDATIFSSRMFGATDLHDNSAQFGAEQVIIVRDFAQKTSLKEVIGDFALILTIMESKGMEFEDVLLYDFFTTSECISDFRALANLSTSIGFDGAKHIALCSELKQLYVAITRAQNRLWFFEKKAVNLAPMLSIWTTNEPIVEVAHIEDKNIQEKLVQLRPGSNANPEIWSTKGHEFIGKKDYQSALFCFGRAKDKRGESLANAFIAEKNGRALLARGDEDRSEGFFRTAIELFHQCGYPLREAACYETLRMFKEAADIFSKNREFGRAGDLYNKINFFEEAAWNYSRAQRYNEGASTLARGNLFDNLVHYLNDNGSFLDSDCRLHYSRLCNLLLKRGKISPELSELTVAALQSDTEKEEFFLEYEMISQLSAFYISKGRYSDACDLAIKDGNPDKAWEVNESYGGMDQLSQQKKIQVFNYAQARRLLANLAPDHEKIFQPDASWGLECAWLLDSPTVTDFWGNLEQITNDLWNHKITYMSINFANIWMKQIFDIIVTFKAHAFVNSAKAVLQLPIESVNEVLRIAKETITAETIPASLLIFLRVFPTKPETKLYTVLKSSPLLAEPDSLPSDKTDTVRTITRWILSQVCAAVDMIDAKALELYNRDDPCVSVLSQAVCRRAPGRCRSHRNQTTSSEFSVLMDEVLAVNTIFYNILPLYHLRFGGLGPEEYSKSVRPRQRRWLESLLAKVTYVSSFEHDPAILARVRRDISRMNSPHPGVLGGLQHLLFHRLGSDKGWDRMCDFSSMLEQLQVAESLSVLPSFKRCLGPKAYLGSKESKNSWEALQRIEWSIYTNRNTAEILDGIVQAVERKELYSYHAVASLYENMATSLIYKSNPADFLLPNGWVEMYLQPERGQPGNSKMESRDALLSLIRSFCGLVKKIDSDSQFSHKLSGRHRSWDLGLTIFIRRNVDFLLTCVLNAFAWRTSRGGQRPGNTEFYLKHTETRALVFQVLGLGFAYAPEFLQCPSDYALARKFVRSFDRYAGKDSPRIIKARNTVSFFAFLESSASISAILLESLQSQPEPASNETTSYPDDRSGNHTQAVLRAVETIQRMWRTRYRIIQKRREFSKSPSGQAVLYMRRVCNAVTEEASLSRAEKIWRTGVLFSDGLDVYLYVKAIEKLYLEKKKSVQAQLESVDPSQMESVQYQWETIYTIQNRVSQSAGFLSERNWHELDIPGQNLRWKCEKVLKTLQGIEVDLRVVDCSEREVTAAEVIQRMWRMRYPLVLKRREFFNTPSGEAILYINRIYKTVLWGTSLDRKERVRRAAVFFDEGLNIYGYIKRVEELYLVVKDTVRLRISDAQMGRVQEQSEKMSQIRLQVRGNVGFMSEENWKELDISSSELRERFKEALRFLKGIESDLRDIMADDGFFSGRYLFS